MGTTSPTSRPIDEAAAGERTNDARAAAAWAFALLTQAKRQDPDRFAQALRACLPHGSVYGGEP